MLFAGLLALAMPLMAHSEQGGYRLLELDGHKVKWGQQTLGAGARVSYALATDSLRFDEARNCGKLTSVEALSQQGISMATLARETAAAFRVWARAAELSFHRVDNAEDADIIIGAQGEPRGRAFANVSYVSAPTQRVRRIDQGVVCLNPTREWKVGFGGDEAVYDIGYTLIHEIGHTIGLDHPGPSGQVMAFRYTEAHDRLQPGDLRGVRRLYGSGAENMVFNAPGTDRQR